MALFSKLYKKEESDLFKWLIKNPLRMAIFITIGSRVRCTDSDILGLKKGEFTLSKTEYAKFGLKKSQNDQIYRILMDLIHFGVIEKTSNQTSNAHATIYRYITNDLMDCSLEISNEISNKQATNKQRTSTNKERKKERKKEKNYTAHTSVSNECEITTKEYKYIDQNERNDFEIFWKLYPRKVSKAQAKKQFNRRIKTNQQFEDLLIAIKNYSLYVRKREKKYIKHCSTWLVEWEEWIDFTEERKEEILINENKFNANQINILKQLEAFRLKDKGESCAKESFRISDTEQIN